MSKLSSEHGSRKSVSSIVPSLKNLNELYEAGDYDGIKYNIENAPIEENSVAHEIKKLWKRAVDDMDMGFFQYLFSYIDEKLFRKSFFRHIVKKGASNFVKSMLEEISEIVKLTWIDIQDAVECSVDTYAIDFLLVKDFDIHTLDLINAADPSKYGNQSDESKNSLLVTFLENFFQFSAFSIAEKGAHVSNEAIDEIRDTIQGEVREIYPEFYLSLSNPIFTRKNKKVPTYLTPENKSIQSTKMSKLSSEYGSRKSVSSIEPTLYNVNKLYESGDYDGITIAIENEINKYFEEENSIESVRMAETNVFDNLVPLTSRAIKDINVPFIEYIFSENIQGYIRKSIRRYFIETILENNDQILISRIQKEIPDAVRIRYKDIDKYLSYTDEPITHELENNIEHLISSIDPTKYKNKHYGEELLDMLLSLDMELSAISLAKKGIKLTLEEIEALKIKYPNGILDDPIFCRESPQKTPVRSPSKSPVQSISKSPVRSTSIQKKSASSKIEYVTNPKTGRQIQVGGPTFRQLQKEKYQYFNGIMVKR